MICTSVAGFCAQRCMEVVAELPMAEIRLDSMDLTMEEVVKIFSAHSKLVATCRPKQGLGIVQRMGLLEKAIESGSAYVDLQLQWPKTHMRHLINMAHRAQCRVIVSYHDFKGTPRRDELLRICDTCFDVGADLAKIACMVNEPSDSARLLGLLGTGASRIIVVGMGRLGLITRLAAPLLGSPFTYASVEAGRQTAPGQVDTATLRRWFDTIGKSTEYHEKADCEKAE